MPDLDPALPASLREATPASLDDADRYLMWGMLVDAAETLVLRPEDPWHDDEVLVHEIRDWVFADDPDWPFSFVNACAAAGIEVARLRAELGTWLAIAPGAARE